MNDPEDFLTRWSRRKHAAMDAPDSSASDAPPDAKPEQGAADAPSGVAATSPAPADTGAGESPFDLSKLPPIESITAETDIRAFLAPGVPAELRVAALRRAWVSDPKVRDFVGLNDYDFDFHTPGAIPGFGPLTMTDELRQEVARIVGGLQADESPPATSAAEPSGAPPQASTTPEQLDARAAATDATATSESSAHQDHPAQDQDELIPAKSTPHRSKDSAASQQEQPKAENLQTLAKPSHGRALPH